MQFSEILNLLKSNKDIGFRRGLILHRDGFWVVNKTQMQLSYNSLAMLHREVDYNNIVSPKFTIRDLLADDWEYVDLSIDFSKNKPIWNK